MKTFEKFLQKALTRHKYSHVSKSKGDLVNTLRVYKCLAPSSERYVFQTGQIEELVNIAGTIPVRYREERYNIPIRIWIPKTYPEEAPICYVSPTQEMEINVSPYVTHSGLVELPCLTDWQHPQTDILSFLQICTVTFSENPPVFAKAPRGIKKQLSRNKSEEERYDWEDDASQCDTQDEMLLKDTLIDSASEICKSKLGEEFSKTRAEIDTLHSENKDLIEGQEIIHTILEKKELKEGEINDEINTITAVLEDLKLVLKLRSEEREISKEDLNKELENLIQIPFSVHSQLLEAVADDAAIDDCIYTLGRNLNVISTDQYLKHVRDLSRKQFLARYIIINCQKLNDQP